MITMLSFSPSMPGSFQSYDQPRMTDTNTSIFRSPQPSASVTRDSRFTSDRAPLSTARPASRNSQTQHFSQLSARKRPRLDSQQRLRSSRPAQCHVSAAHTSSSIYFGSPASHAPSSSCCNLDGSQEYEPNTSVNSSTYSLRSYSYNSAGFPSPSPLVNTQYDLKGGLDTPTAAFERRLEELGSSEEEQDWRVNRFQSREHDPTLGRMQSETRKSSTTASYVTARTCSGSSMGSASRKRTYESTETPRRHTKSRSLTGWNVRSTAWALTGGLAVKAISFAWNTAFSGFKAGGGEEYTFDAGSPGVSNHPGKLYRIEPHNDVFSEHYDQYTGRSQLPGDFHQSPQHGGRRPSAGFLGGREQNNLTPTLSNQNQGLERSVLRNGWTMVDDVEYQESDNGSPARKKSRASVAGGARRSNSFRGSNGASYASPRARTVTAPYAASNATLNSPEMRRPRLSVASSSPRRSQSSYFGQSTDQTQQAEARSPSTLSPEVRQYKRQIRKKEKAHDETMARLNAQMKEMIKQGKEALGTTFKVEDETDEDDAIDEGYYEDGIGRAWSRSGRY